MDRLHSRRLIDLAERASQVSKAVLQVQSVTMSLKWLESTPFAEFIRESAWAFPTIESVHVIALALVVGTIVIVDLRLLGFASASVPYADLSREVLPWTWVSFTLAVISGGLMFISQPLGYFDNFAFRTKILLLCLAGINMLVFQLFTSRGASGWRGEDAVPVLGKIAAGLSLALWVMVVFVGRWIGFTMTPT
jgi:hypothetical protein